VLGLGLGLVLDVCERKREGNVLICADVAVICVFFVTVTVTAAFS